MVIAFLLSPAKAILVIDDMMRRIEVYKGVHIVTSISPYAIESNLTTGLLNL